MIALLRAAMNAHAEHGVDEEQQHQQLQKQEDVVAQPLKQAIDVQILDALLPQKRARHLDRLALQAKEVEDHEQDRQKEQYERDPRRHPQLIGDIEVRQQPLIDRRIGVEEPQHDEN